MHDQVPQPRAKVTEAGLAVEPRQRLEPAVRLVRALPGDDAADQKLQATAPDLLDVAERRLGRRPLRVDVDPLVVVDCSLAGCAQVRLAGS